MPMYMYKRNRLSVLSGFITTQHVIPALHFQPRNKGGRMLEIVPDPQAVNSDRVHTHRVTDATVVNSFLYAQHSLTTRSPQTIIW